MNETEIRKYAQLMGELGLTGLEIKDQDQVVRLERSYAVSASPAAVPAPAPQEEPVSQAGGVTVRSPMVGTFYQAPAENAEPYVKTGDHVAPGTVLCLIEAMKMMNEITAEQAGTILEVCAENGQMVDYGCPLFRIGRE